MSTKIEWVKGADGMQGETWNPVTGCTKVSSGCKHCYAESVANRFWKDRKFTDVQCHEDKLAIPLKRKKPTTYFVNSMSDLFHEAVPFEFIDKVFAVMALCPQHVFQVLTKRPERMLEYLNRPMLADRFLDMIQAVAKLKHDLFLEGSGSIITEGQWILPNLWLGISAENQEQADERIMPLLQCPAAVRWVSAEPLLGPINFTRIPTGDWAYGKVDVMSGYLCGDEPDESPEDDDWSRGEHGIDWVVCGGESGPNARDCCLGWLLNIADQCKNAGVPYFLKQVGARPIHRSLCHPVDWDHAEAMDPGRWRIILKDRKGGDPQEWPEDMRVREFPTPAGRGGAE